MLRFFCVVLDHNLNFSKIKNIYLLDSLLGSEIMRINKMKEYN